MTFVKAGNNTHKQIAESGNQTYFIRMHRLKIILSYAALYIVWSTTYYAIKLSVLGFASWYVVGIRFFLGGLGLSAAVILMSKLRAAAITRQEITGALVTGALLLAGGNGFVTLGQRHVDSYLAALIVASTPIVVIGYDWLIMRKSVPLIALSGALVGIAGVGTLLFDASREAVAPNASLLFVVLGVLLWGLGTSLSKKLAQPKAPVLTSAIQLTAIGALTLIVTTVVSPHIAAEQGVAVPLVSFLALGYLVAIGSVTLVCYSFLLRHEPNYRITTYALVNPLFAVMIGLFIANEHPVKNMAPGALLIIAGIALVLYGPLLFGKKACENNV
ncbi:MAG: EamA family transporter [Chitinispirillaceae bacterium]|nr:EamA family transporter [Chitinispirillaceae bacterium]